MARVRRRWMPPSPERGRMPEPCPLLEMPRAWLFQLIKQLPADSLKALLFTSKRTMALVLQHVPSHPSARLTVTLLQQNMEQLLQKVHRASQLWAPFSLRLRVEPGRLWVTDGFNNGHMRWVAAGVVWRAMLGCSQPWGNLTSLELMNLQLDALFSPQLAHGCPRLTKLSYIGCSITWSEVQQAALGPFSAPWPLEELSMRVSCGDEGWAACSSALEQQVQQLHALRSLELDCMEDWPCAVVQGAAQHASQVTRLIADYARPLDKLLLQEGAALLQRFTAVQHLGLNSTSVSDAQLQALLSLPALTHVSVARFELSSSFAHHQVSWQQLRFDYPTLAQLARLPTGPNLHLQGHGTDAIRVDDDVETARAAARNVSRCRSISWGTCQRFDSRHFYGADDWEEEEDEDEEVDEELVVTRENTALATIVPLFTGATDAIAMCGFSLHAELDAALLAVLGQHVHAAQSSLRLVDCMWDSAALLALVETLPPQARLNITWTNTLVEEEQLIQLTELCVGVAKPLHLTLENNTRAELPAGWQQDTQSAMRAAGHQHVTIELLRGELVDIEWLLR